MPTSYYRYLFILTSLLALYALLMAINPVNRHDWMLENVLFFLFVITLIITFKKFPLSKISYTFIFIFLLLHETGSHFTYALVPYDEYSLRYMGFSINELFGFERNHFDRLTHFSYGLLLAYPVREVFIRIADVRGFWSYFLPLDLTLSTSALYELVEWGAAEIFGGELGQAYLGTQGDIWDAHKDMALAALGAFTIMLIFSTIHRLQHRDFSREWNESLRIKHPKPLD